MKVVLAMAVFIASHVIIARTGLKPWLVERLGRRGYLLAYSLLSIALLAWVVVALLGTARVTFWAPPAWSWVFAAVVSGLGSVLIGIALVTPNPLSVSFRTEGFDPGRPGAIGWVRHPLLWGLSLWGLAHVPANGDWPSLALFGGSALFGLIGMRAVDRRHRRQLGDARWRNCTAARGHLDHHCVAGTALGLTLWLGLLLAHPTLFGAHPLAVLRAQFGIGF